MISKGFKEYLVISLVIFPILIGFIGMLTEGLKVGLNSALITFVLTIAFFCLVFILRFIYKCYRAIKEFIRYKLGKDRNIVGQKRWYHED